MGLASFLTRLSTSLSFRRHTYDRVYAVGDDLEAGSKQSDRARWVLRAFIAIFALAIPLAYWRDARDVRTLPTLESIYRSEDLLPQHNVDTGLNTRYVRFLNQHHWGAGFNNLWEEFILLHEIALRANRSYAFKSLIFADQTVWPMNTFMAGPTAGGPWPTGVDAPRAISSTWWQVACPPHRRRRLHADDIWSELELGDAPDGETLVARWAAYLRDLPYACVEIDGRGFFDLDFWFGKPQRAVAVWPALSRSPILTHHAWSPAVYSAVSRNLPLLTGGRMSAENERFANIVDDAPAPVPAPLREYREMSNVVALHIRRGDYEGHCWILGHFSAPYASWNVLPGLPDTYTPDPSTQETKMLVMPHCLPSPQQVAARVENVTKEYNAARGAKVDKLEMIYLMTNANDDFLAELRTELKGVGYDRMITAKDMQLHGTEKYANMIIDMEIGVRAALFVGNGFSTLTSTVVALREVRGAPLITNRFW